MEEPTSRDGGLHTVAARRTLGTVPNKVPEDLGHSIVKGAVESETALIIFGMVAFIAAYHYLRIFNSGVESYSCAAG